MPKTKRGRKSKKANLVSFWRKCTLWGLAFGVVVGACSAAGSIIEGGRVHISFGVGGFLIGFFIGFVIKAVDRLPPRGADFLYRGNYIGGNKVPDIEEIIDSQKKNK